MQFVIFSTRLFDVFPSSVLYFIFNLLKAHILSLEWAWLSVLCNNPATFSHIQPVNTHFNLFHLVGVAGNFLRFNDFLKATGKFFESPFYVCDEIGLDGYQVNPYFHRH